jgi:hypothetical protein
VTAARLACGAYHIRGNVEVSHERVIGKGGVRWSKAVCATLSRHGPMSPSRAAKTLANGLAADPFFGDVLASLHPHPEHKVDLERVVEIRDLRFSGF